MMEQAYLLFRVCRSGLDLRNTGTKLTIHEYQRQCRESARRSCPLDKRAVGYTARNASLVAWTRLCNQHHGLLRGRPVGACAGIPLSAAAAVATPRLCGRG